MEEQNRVLPKEAVVNSLTETVDAAIYELEHIFIPQLKHGEAKRLLLAVLKYPKEDADFSADRIELRQAFSCAKQLQDALTGLATEVVIERLISDQMAEQATEEAKEGSND